MDHDGTRASAGAAPHRRGLMVVGVALIVVMSAACGGGGGSSGADVARFCNDLRGVLTAIDGLGGGLAPPGRSELTGLAAEMDKLAGEAPSEIKGDVKTVGAYFQKASEHGLDSVDASTSTAADAAGTRIGTFGDQRCGAPPDNAP